MIRAVGRVRRADSRRVELEVPGWPGHTPGQFAMLSFDPRQAGVGGGSEDPLLPRPMALFRRDGDVLDFRFQIVGRGTRRLAALPAGSALGVLGPLGNGFPPPPGPVALVGGGTGIASLYELASGSPTGSRVRLGGRSRPDLLGAELFSELPLDVGFTTEDGSFGDPGRVTDDLSLDGVLAVYACGPRAMLEAVFALARKAGVPCLVSLENHMACGFGICLGCAVSTDEGFRYVCTHGPVFRAETLDWDALP